LIGRVREYLTVGCNTKLIYVVVFFLIYATFVGNPNLLGFYEDDFYQIVPSLDGFTEKNLKQLENNLTGMPQGRPIGFSVPVIMGILSSLLGGKVFLYTVLALIHFFVFFVSKNIFEKEFQNKTYGIYGGLLTVFCTSDTTHSLLIHAFQVHFSLLLSLTGILFLQNKKNKTSYLFFIMSALCYESSVLLFVFFPLLFIKDRKTIVLHFAKCGVLLLLILLFRKYFLTSEERVIYLFQRPDRILQNIMQSIVLGPLTSLRRALSFICDIQWLKLYESFGWSALIIIINIIIYFFSRLHSSRDKDSFLDLKKVGVALFVLSATYLLNISHDPTRYISRLTSVHLNASVVVSYFIICIFIFVSRTFTKINILLPVLVTLSSLYHFNIQLDFVNSWSKQKIGWGNAIDVFRKYAHEDNVYIINNYYENLGVSDYTFQGPHHMHIILTNHFEEFEKKPYFIGGTRFDIRDKFKLEKNQDGEWTLIDKENYGYIDHYMHTKIDLDKVFVVTVAPYEDVIIRKLNYDLEIVDVELRERQSGKLDLNKISALFSE
jgi:hypothetical protein